MYKITAIDSTMQTNGQSIHSTANKYGKFRTFQVIDGNGRIVYEAQPAELNDSRALTEARADCQDFIDGR